MSKRSRRVEGYHLTDFPVKRTKKDVIPIAAGVVAGAIYSTKAEIGQIVSEIKKNLFDDGDGPSGTSSGGWKETDSGQPAELNFEDFLVPVVLGIIVWGIVKLSLKDRSREVEAHA